MQRTNQNIHLCLDYCLVNNISFLLIMTKLRNFEHGPLLNELRYIQIQRLSPILFCLSVLMTREQQRKP